MEMQVVTSWSENCGEKDTIAAILRQIWNVPIDPDLLPYSNFYQEKCRYFLVENGRYVLTKDQSNIILYCRRILSGEGRDAIRSDLLNRFRVDDTEIADITIDLCASLISMIEVGRHLFRRSGHNPIYWTSGPFRSCVDGRFTPQRNLSPGSMKLGKGFTAWSLRRISGMEIKWTTNLADHLLLADDDRSVSIFHCVIFLKMQQG